MYSGPSRPESGKPTLPPYGHQPMQSAYHQQPYGFAQRTPIELPRPLEPRPSLHTSLSDSSGAHRHHDAFRGPAPSPSEYRALGPNLPGLRDILTTSHHGSPQARYDSPQWSTTAGAQSRFHPSEAHHNSNGWHPPLTVHQPGEPPQNYSNGRRVDLPVLESSPLPRQSLQSLPASPYSGYPEAREHADARPDQARQASVTSRPVNGVTSPYAGSPDEVKFQNVGTVPDRPPIPAVGNEPSRKYLGIKEVVGEGAYHLYEGGYRIPTQVDGEQVNPAWGLTKANKPRKRLALACLDCREKKIKCEPGVNSCLQCEKAKRHCRRAPLQPSQPEGTATAPAWPNGIDSPVRKVTSEPTPQVSRDGEIDAINKRRSREDSSPPNMPAKKHRSASPNQIKEALMMTAIPEARSSAAPLAVQNTTETNGKMLTWDDDPYAVDRETTMYLLEMYFAHVNDASYSLLPRNAFLHWVRSAPYKCQLERMVLYAMLAVGSIFADSHYSGFAKQCVQIAQDAIAAKTGVVNIPVIHARLLLALYHNAKGADILARDYAGAAIRAATSPILDLQKEEKTRDPADTRTSPQVEIPFGLNDEQFKECKRRTFWSCFLMDRYEDGHMCAIALADIFLRLPCLDEFYERGLRSDAPRYNNGIIDESLTFPPRPVSTMAHVCLLAAIWGDVFTFIQRMQHRSDQTFAEAYEEFYVQTQTRIQSWSSSLPNHLQYNEYNLLRSVREGYAAGFISMHALHHMILMRLNRYVRHRCLSTDGIKRNIREARHYAHALLDLVTSARLAAREQSSDDRHLNLVFSNPFVGNVILSAVDIASAGGLDSTFGIAKTAVTNGLQCLDILAKCWNSAKGQFSKSEKRLYSIDNVVHRPFKAQNGAWLSRKWGILDPLEDPGEFNHDWRPHDCIYADRDGYSPHYFEAIKEDGNPQGRMQKSGSSRLV
ncbi:hypothetical protein LTR56_022876 [Elasticomyces elasticus]|nr:hypothetical protein LTR56_022876 [Elasticomyces elasticus]